MKYILFLFIALYFSACISDPPPIQINSQNLEYEWTIDTLKNPNGYGIVPYSSWGSSDSSVWIAGFNLVGQGEIFHWNGKKWNRITPDLGFNYEILSIFGFSENEVYAVGSKLVVDTALHTEALILKYDGNVWQREDVQEGSGLIYIHGNSPNDIWASGYFGSLYHKINNQWKKESFNQREYLDLLSEQPDLGPLYVAPDGELYIMNEYYNYKAFGDTAMFYFSKYGNNTIEDLDSTKLVNIDGIRTGYKFGNASLFGKNKNEIYSAGDAIFKFDGDKWVTVMYDEYMFRDIKGTANNIFAVGNHGTINYFNGSWQRIGDFSQFIVDFYSVMPFENKIFIGAHERGVGYVLRGKIKK